MSKEVNFSQRRDPSEEQEEGKEDLKQTFDLEYTATSNSKHVETFTGSRSWRSETFSNRKNRGTQVLDLSKRGADRPATTKPPSKTQPGSCLDTEQNRKSTSEIMNGSERRRLQYGNSATAILTSIGKKRSRRQYGRAKCAVELVDLSSTVAPPQGETLRPDTLSSERCAGLHCAHQEGANPSNKRTSNQCHQQQHYHQQQNQQQVMPGPQLQAVMQQILANQQMQMQYMRTEFAAVIARDANMLKLQIQHYNVIMQNMATLQACPSRMAPPGSRQRAENHARMGLEERRGPRAERNVFRFEDPSDERPCHLVKGLKKVGDVWEEWEFGIKGNKPARLWTTEDRRGNPWASTYCRRLGLYNHIKRMVDAGHGWATAVRLIEKQYPEKNVNDISRDLKKRHAKGTLHPSLSV